MGKPLIVITGASSGIGEAVAKSFAKIGRPLLRVVVISPGVIETEILDHVTNAETLKNHQKNKLHIGGGIPADHVADMILFAYNMPQNVLIQEMVVTPTRQEF